MFSSKQVYENLYNPLKELGLTTNQISLYCTSLALGPTSLTELAKSLNIARPNLYKLIVELETHGLANFSERKKHARRFVVEPPTIIKDLLHKKSGYLDQLQKEIIGSLPDLLALHHQGELPTKIKILEGREQWLKIFYEILEEEKTETQFFGSFDDWIKFVSWEHESKWIKERIKRKIKIKLLVRTSEQAIIFNKDAVQAYREFKFLKDNKLFNCCFQIFANKVILWQPVVPLALLIEDEYIVSMFKSIFYLLWEHVSVKT